MLDALPVPSFMELLDDAVVDLTAGIDSFDVEAEGADVYADEEEDDEAVDDDEVMEVDAAGAVAAPKPRTANYTEIEDMTLVRAWGKVGMDATTGVDQGGKRYWQRIEDQYHQMKPRTKNMADRSFRSLEGRWKIGRASCRERV